MLAHMTWATAISVFIGALVGVVVFAWLESRHDYK